MSILRSSLVALLLAAASPIALTAPAHAQVVIGIRVAVAPPVLPVYVQPALPGPGYIWAPGYWAWSASGYYWVPGTWVLAPRPGLLWTPGYWGWNNGFYVFNAGYWGPHVGFYGGISYGFGYTGIGFQGGYWNNGAFFYNSAAANLGGVQVTNVYNTTIVNNTTNKVSYNGGIAAKPTPAELAAAKEPHVAPTALQAQHEQAAAKNPGNFAANNHGQPAIAATSKPGVFSGPGVVSAGARPSALTKTPAGASPPAGAGAAKPNFANPAPLATTPKPVAHTMVKPKPQIVRPAPRRAPPGPKKPHA
jgi:hypothetical protein